MTTTRTHHVSRLAVRLLSIKQARANLKCLNCFKYRERWFLPVSCLFFSGWVLRRETKLDEFHVKNQCSANRGSASGSTRSSDCICLDGFVDVAVIVVILGRFKKASRLMGEEFEKVIANQSQLKSILIDDFLKKKWSSEI